MPTPSTAARRLWRCNMMRRCSAASAGQPAARRHLRQQACLSRVALCDTLTAAAEQQRRRG
eukprot:7775454-Alexandrium_andersonii.AAC.1